MADLSNQPPQQPPQQPFITPPSRLGQLYIQQNPPPRFYTNQAIVTRQVYRKCSPVGSPQVPVQSSRSSHTFTPPRGPPSRQCPNPPSRQCPNPPPNSFRPTPQTNPRSGPRPMPARPNSYSNTTGRELCFRCGELSQLESMQVQIINLCIYNRYLICNLTGKEVFYAERAQGYRGVYHKTCFVCYSCNKSLDPKTVHEDGGNLYCKGCYNRLVGPSGVGFGVGAGVLQTK